MKHLNAMLAWATMATSVAAAPVSLETTVEETYTPIVPKTIFSSKLRLVFVLGVEGTGHHYFVSVDSHLFRNQEQLVHIPHDGFNGHLYDLQYSMAEGVARYSEALDRARNNMRELAQRGAEMEHPGTVVFTYERFSYPNGHGPNKVFKYIDLRIMAEMAEEQGLDFRVVYLHRDIKDLIIANTVHRDFQNSLHNGGYPSPEEKFMQYMQVLFTDIAVVHSFLGELDPAFVVCFDYDRLGDINQFESVAEFLAPNEDVAKSVNSSFVAVAHASARPPESLPYEGADVVASRFKRKFDVFESQLCSSTRRE